MGRQKNDGRGRLGGRAKGTQNKPLAPVGIWLSDLVDKNRTQFENDLQNCTPYERASILAQFISNANAGSI